MKGIIEKVEVTSATSKDGKPWKRWAVTIGGKKYSTFDSNLGPKLNVGATYELEVEQKGSYYNLLAAMPIAEESGPLDRLGAIVNPPEPKIKQGNGQGSGRDAAIERMHREKTRAACLEAASRVLSINASVEKKPVEPKAVVKLAEDYFEWTETEF